MAEIIFYPDQGLAAFDADHSPLGLLERYAGGRVAHFAARQILTIVGSVSLALLATPLHGLAAICTALLGEAVDCLTLRRVPAWRAAGRDIDWLIRITTLTAAFQALTISACILISQVGAPAHEVSFFAIAFLTGAAMNAGLVLPFHPSATVARLAIYALTCAIFLGIETFGKPGLTARNGFDLLATIMLIYMVKVFLTYVAKTQSRALAERRDLLLGAEALATTNRDLQESQREARQLSLVARHANDSVIISHPDTGILWVNEAFTQMTGYALQDAVGRKTGALLNGPDTDAATVAAIDDALSRGQPHRTEVLNYDRTGQPMWVETNLVPLLDDSGKPEVIIAIERNISEAKDHARQLAEAMHRAEDGARAKAAFLATMSHEIRTPMNGIIGMAGLLSESQLTPDQRDYITTIHDSAEALLKIINDILDFSRLEAKKLTITDETFSLAVCLRSAISLMRPQAREKGLFLDISHDTPLPDHVSGDSGRLRQILINLIGNAIKFTARGGVTLRVAITPDGADHHDIDIRVEDTGIGIPPDRAERIFDQFEQADADTTRKFGGTGLGLAISRELARTMGGDLVLCPSAPGHLAGATFRLRVRVGRALLVIPQAPDQTDLHGSGLAGLSLLVADDNRINRHLIQRYLESEDIHLRFAENGREAVTLALAAPPDIILMDMSMPELDGLSATREIRAADLLQPHIIALTANAFASDRAACKAAGMNDFLTKPLRKAQLFAALARATEKAVGPAGPHRVSRTGPAHEAPNWTSQPESGTTNGRSTRSSGP